MDARLGPRPLDARLGPRALSITERLGALPSDSSSFQDTTRRLPGRQPSTGSFTKRQGQAQRAEVIKSLDKLSLNTRTLEAKTTSQVIVTTPVLINGQDALALVDSGANHSFIDVKLAKSVGALIKPSTLKVNFGGKDQPGLGTTSLLVENGEKEPILVTFALMDHDQYQVILGTPEFKALGYELKGIPSKKPGPSIINLDELLPSDNEESSAYSFRSFEKLDPRLQQALKKNQAIDPLSSCTHPLGFVEIEFTERCTYWNSHNIIGKYKDQADLQIKEWLARGVIEKAANNALICLPLLAVPKRNEKGEETGMRLCLNAAPLNAYCKDDFYPIPTIQQCLKVAGRKRGKSTRRSKIDLSQAYHRFRCTPGNFNFLWNSVLYTYGRVFFGGKVFPAAFQRCMDSITRTAPFVCLSYFDDIFNEGGTPEEDLAQSIWIIDTLTSFNMIVNMDKSFFGAYEIPALGYVVDGEGIRMHPSKVEAILNWKFPQSGDEISRFMGTVGFSRDHIPQFAITAKPLDEKRTAKSFVPTQAMLDSFDKIKQLVANHVKLTVEDESRPVLIGTDASADGMGFWRGQSKAEFTSIPPEDLKPDQIEILQFASKAFNTAGRKASASLRELLAVIYALKKCEPLLQGRRFYLFTDHQALVWLFTGGHTSPMLLRWIDFLMSLDYVVIYWKGVINVIADAMSRKSCLNHFHLYSKVHEDLLPIDELIATLEFNELWRSSSLEEGQNSIQIAQLNSITHKSGVN